MLRHSSVAEVDEERELLGVWLSRCMFNVFVGWPPETRTWQEFLADHGVAVARAEDSE